jgi:hypothetical protein
MSPRQASLNEWLTAGRRKTNEGNNNTNNFPDNNNDISTDISINLTNSNQQQQQQQQQRTRIRVQPRELVQQSLLNNDINRTPFDHHWGHPLPFPKSDTSFRIGFRNVNSLPMQASDIKK